MFLTNPYIYAVAGFPTTDLVSYYKLDTNGSANDSIGGNDLTISGATFTASGKINGGYSLSDGNYLRDASASGIATGNGEKTISFWAKWGNGTGLSGAQYDWCIAIGINDPTDYYPIAIVRGTSADHIQLIQKDSGGFTQSTSVQVKDDGNWHFYVARRSSSGTVMELYEDDIRILNSTGLTGRSPTWTGGIIIINGNLTLAANSFDQTYVIDEVGIWNRALTTTEMTTLYNGGVGLSY